MPTTTMQIRTRRRRGRKISRRRPRKVSRRQSLSRRRLKPRSGGTTKENEEIDPATIALARKLLDNTKIKNYLNNVEKMMIAKLGGEDKYCDAILKAAAAARHQAGGASQGENRDNNDQEHHEEDLPPSIAASAPASTVFRNILDIIGRITIRIPRGDNMMLLVGLILMMFMMGANARIIHSDINTPALDNMLNVYDPSRPGQIWSFWNALFALFGYGPGPWGHDPLYYWQGPPRPGFPHPQLPHPDFGPNWGQGNGPNGNL